MPAVNLKLYRAVRNGLVVWMTLVILGAFLLAIPRINILEHTARNLYFHVPMWFAMMAATMVSAWHSYKFLRSDDLLRDIRAAEAARMAIFFGLLGLVTGMMWARFTWYQSSRQWWNFDPKQSMAAVQVMIYAGYLVLRSALDDPRRRGRVSAVFNLFAVVTMPFLLYVLPRQMESLHPGAEGNPAFSEITHPIMRLVFYPAVIGFIALFWVIYTQRVRTRVAEQALEPEPQF